MVDGYQNIGYQNLVPPASLFQRNGDADPDCDLDHPNGSSVVQTHAANLPPPIKCVSLQTKISVHAN